MTCTRTIPLPPPAHNLLDKHIPSASPSSTAVNEKRKLTAWLARLSPSQLPPLPPIYYKRPDNEKSTSPNASLRPLESAIVSENDSETDFSLEGAEQIELKKARTECQCAKQKTRLERPKSMCYLQRWESLKSESSRAYSSTICVWQDNSVQAEERVADHVCKRKEASKSIRRTWSNVEVSRLRTLFRRVDGVERRHTFSPSSSNPQVYLEDLALQKESLHQTLDAKLVLNYEAKETQEKYDGERSLASLAPPAAIEDSEHHLRMRWFITKEILTTEESFHSHLCTILTEFKAPLEAAARTEKPLIDPAEVALIFAHVDELEKVSATLTAALATALKENSSIGRVFLHHVSDFDVFVKYAINFANAQKALQRANGNILYREFVRESMRSSKYRLRLDDLRIMPIQRLAQYCLLLRNLLKYTPKDHPEHNILASVIRQMSAVTLAANDVQKQRSKKKPKLFLWAASEGVKPLIRSSRYA
ncbi:uncharacterized protein VTP21DRAFT_1965 [Calcarisporiella thermophila]|uniref:uncharacterized protein n=1 Tax=Calcarisporiella thermophila TaxID=911321 RepID=UPI0037424FD8